MTAALALQAGAHPPLPPAGGPQLIVLVGAAGAGKSRWAGRNYPPDAVLCLDRLRAQVAGDENDQDATPAAVALLLATLEQRLAAGLTTVVDATSSRADHRAALVAAARRHQTPPIAAVFAPRLETCLARNAARPGPARGRSYGRRVPAQVVAAQHAGVVAALEHGFAGEGFAQIWPISGPPPDVAAGTVYLLHFEKPYSHARHYTGWTTDLAARLAEHEAGRGARLLAVVQAAGISWTLARTWTGPRVRERALKNQGGASRRCPLCGVAVHAAATST